MKDNYKERSERLNLKKDTETADIRKKIRLNQENSGNEGKPRYLQENQWC